MFGLQLLANAPYFVQDVGMDSANSLTLLVWGTRQGLIATLISLGALNVFGRGHLILLTPSTAWACQLPSGDSDRFTKLIIRHLK